MAFFSEIFFSTLVGKPVYTIDEKFYGYFRDFVVKRVSGNFMVTKIRIKNLKGERMILSWNEVHSIDANPVSLKLKRQGDGINSVDYNDTELRLKRDFLDQQIIDTEEHRLVRVNDLKIVAVKDELFMVAADIGFRGLLRRIGIEQFALYIAQLFHRSFSNTLVPSKFIDPFPARIRHDITLTVAQDELKKMHPADLADIVEDLDHFERISILQSLPVETMAETIAELDPAMRKELLGKFKDVTLSKVLEQLSPDMATDIIAELPRRRMYHILTIMKSADATRVRELLEFTEDTAGSLMNTEFMALPEALTAGEAIELLRKKGDKAEQIFYIYIVGDDDILKGAISLRDLIFVEPDEKLADLIKRKAVYVKLKDSVQKVVETITKYNLIALPVVGKKRKLEGVITVDDILPLLQETKQ